MHGSCKRDFDDYPEMNDFMHSYKYILLLYSRQLTEEFLFCFGGGYDGPHRPLSPPLGQILGTGARSCYGTH